MLTDGGRIFRVLAAQETRALAPVKREGKGKELTSDEARRESYRTTTYRGTG